MQQQQQMNPDAELRLVLKARVAEYVLNALARCPYLEVAPILQDIQMQIQQQMQPQPPPPFDAIGNGAEPPAMKGPMQ